MVLRKPVERYEHQQPMLGLDYSFINYDCVGLQAKVVSYMFVSDMIRMLHPILVQYLVSSSSLTPLTPQ